ncbi:MAG TPA: class I SAM-dependent methyltransferase [Dyella sp.]|uniref:class I SAM-dependent methyltransferase n=1 Tax=Dyella sp. TaxID=1869338 RepID=UPI002BFA84EC|nr:class I SAM-dependent methyltransferase [Dyella sp.]HTV84701.1 class I SAM-dependent methyltransferase [Dyella sp.]
MSSITKKLLGLSSKSSSNDAASATGCEQRNWNDLSGSRGAGLKDAFLSGWFQNDTNEIFRGIPIGESDVVVDVGCGDGGNSAFCLRRGAKVVLADTDKEAIATAIARLRTIRPDNVETHVSDGNPLPLKDAIATRVMCTEVLEHVDDPAQLMRELVRIGKPGARYLISVPDPLQENLQKHVAPPSYFQKPNHIRVIERQEFSDLVTQAGLVIDEVTYYGFFWSIWWAMFWACGVDLEQPAHPVLDHWTEAWRALMDMPNGHELKRKLDQFMPKSQVIVAHKPA